MPTIQPTHSTWQEGNIVKHLATDKGNLVIRQMEKLPNGDTTPLQDHIVTKSDLGTLKAHADKFVKAIENGDAGGAMKNLSSEDFNAIHSRGFKIIKETAMPESTNLTANLAKQPVADAGNPALSGGKAAGANLHAPGIGSAADNLHPQHAANWLDNLGQFFQDGLENAGKTLSHIPHPDSVEGWLLTGGVASVAGLAGWLGVDWLKKNPQAASQLEATTVKTTRQVSKAL